MEVAVAAGSVRCRASACTAGGCVSPRFALPRVASRARSRQPAWAASAARRGPSARRNGCKNCRALCCRVLRSGLQSRVKRSARGKKRNPSSRHCAECFVYIYGALRSGRDPVIASSCVWCTQYLHARARSLPRRSPGETRKTTMQGTRSGQRGTRPRVIVHSYGLSQRPSPPRPSKACFDPVRVLASRGQFWVD